MDTSYIETLLQRQSNEGWSDREMGRQMNINHATWTRIRQGNRGIGTRVLRAAMARFPEYDGVALAALRSRDTVSA